MNTIQRLEYKYLSKVLKSLNRATWTRADICYNKELQEKFIKEANLDQLSLLRYGELMLGRNIDKVDFTDPDSVRGFMKGIYNQEDELEVPVLVSIISAIIQLAFDEYGKDE